MKIIIFLLSILSISSVFADTVVLKIKKSYHPKNVLNYSVVTNTQCELAQKSGTYVTPYWIMGEEDGHTEGLTSTEQTYYSPKVSYVNTQKTEADFTIKAMDQVRAYIPDPTINIRTSVVNGKCIAEAIMNIDKQEITVREVYISGNLSWTMSWTTDYLTISGFFPDGKPFSKKITVRKNK